jgi:hypothetical protein
VSALRSRSLPNTRRTSKRTSVKKNRSRTRRPHIETLEDRCLLAVSPALLSTIEGLNSSDGIFNIGGEDAAPPDPHGAVGPTHVVNVANRSIQWFTKAGVRHGHTSLVNFFQPLRPLTPPMNPSANIYDPRVLYDQFAERFVVMALERSDTPVPTSRIMMAVSDDSDPNGAWYYTSINTLTNIAAADDPLEILPHYADFAGMAVNSQAVFVTANMLSFDDDEANGSRLWIIDKGIGTGGFYENGRARWTRHDPGGMTSTGVPVAQGGPVDYSVNRENVGRLRSMYPAHIYGNAPSQLGTFLVMYDGRTNMTDEFVDVIRVDNPLTSPTFRLFSVNVGNLEDLPDPFEFDPPPEVPQPLVTTTLDVGDRRVYDAVWRDNNLYFTTVLVPRDDPDATIPNPDVNQTTAYWFRVDTRSAYASPAGISLADQGPISGEDIAFPSYTAFPSIAVDSAGNMAVSFAVFGPGLFPSAYYALRTPSDPPGTLRDSVMLAEGFDAYELEDFNGIVSWGRHSGLAVDPVDNVTFWTFNAYSLPRFDLDGRWGSRWGSFRQASLPDAPPPGPTTIRGVVWQDLNGNGFRDNGEPVVPGAFVYVDLDGDGQVDLTEPTAVTNSKGEYSITVNIDGPVIIREVAPLGWQNTYPGDLGRFWAPPSQPVVTPPAWQDYFAESSDFAHIINIPKGGGGTIQNVSFGRSDALFNWGTAPEPYPTLREDNGARHPVVPSYGLGVRTFVTADGQPNEQAAAEDNDGVIVPGVVVPGQPFTIQVTNRGSGYLQGWFDWNLDKDWNDPGEQVIVNRWLEPGTHTLTIGVPPAAVPGVTYARFRYGKDGNLGPTGASTREGEVEDYRLVIAGPPQANNDFRTVDQFSSNNLFLVLENDVFAGDARILSVSPTSSGGVVTIRNDRLALFYTPPAIGDFDSFEYTIQDEFGSSTARVDVTILPFSGLVPTAVDDTFTFNANNDRWLIHYLDVLRNDLPGPTRSISIVNVFDRDPASNATARVVVREGRQVIEYNPNGDFPGSYQFQYTIMDAEGVQDTAKVTVQLAKPLEVENQNLVGINLEITDAQGQSIPRDNQGHIVIDGGTSFQVRAYAKDLRVGQGPPDFLRELGEGGVWMAHMDFLYDANLTAFSNISFDGPYTQFGNIDTSLPGILDEIGASGPISPPLGESANPLGHLMYVTTFTAMAVAEPTRATFRTDPADRPTSETHLYGTFQPGANPIPFDRIFYGETEVQIVPPRELVEIRLVAYNLDGVPLPNNTIQAGSDFLVRAWVEDIRDDIAPSLKGVFSAYLDVIYPSTLFAPVPSTVSGFGYDISFGDPQLLPADTFLDANAKATFRPNWRPAEGLGLIDEVGAFRTTGRTPPPSPSQLLFTTRFTALNPPGGVLGRGTFRADPADERENEVTLIRSGVVDPIFGDLGLRVPVSQVVYVSTPQITVVGAAGEAEFTNPDNPLDVNNDGYVSPMDALFVMNFLNMHGPVDLKDLFSIGAEGEAATHYYLDTNGDGIISPADVLPIINHLNAVSRLESQGGQAEGEAVWEPMASQNVALVVDPTAVAAMIDLVDASETNGRLANSEAKTLAAGEPLDLLDDAYRVSSLDDGEDSDDLNWWLEDEMVEDIAEAWESPYMEDIIAELVA